VAALRRQLDGARARDRQGAVIDSREFLAELEDAIARLRIVLNALEGTSVAPYDTPRTAGAQPSPLWAWLCCGRASAAASGGVVSPDKTGAGGELSFDHTFKTTRTAAADDTESCAVCLQVLAGTAVVALKCDCSHFYHRSCIEMWLRAKAWSPTCPLCTCDCRRAGAAATTKQHESLLLGRYLANPFADCAPAYCCYCCHNATT